jgi:pyrroline-5-carboxylate reductase
LSSLTDKKIGFIGAGNMARAIIKGLIANDLNCDQIFASDTSADTRKQIADELGIHAGENAFVAERADVLVLAIKPQHLREACEQIRPSIQADTLIISIAAGINCQSLQHWLGDMAIVRAMPNTPAAIGYGACGLYANAKVNEEQRTLAKAVMQAVGSCLYVPDEPLIDAVTAVSGSGPAYFFLFIESMVASATQLGLDEETASELAIQTALGAAQLAKQSNESPGELRKMVTSPNGTTEQAILSFEKHGLRDIVNHAMQACAERAKTLSEELGS